VELPESFTVLFTETRMDRDNDPVYPIFAYLGAKKMLASGDIIWNDLKQSGMRKNNAIKPVQIYTIKIS
jgi:hypothetical protein